VSKLQIDPAEIVRVYNEVGNFRKAAKMLGIGATTARTYLVLAGVKHPVSSPASRVNGEPEEVRHKYYVWRTAVCTRDNYTCVWCGSKDRITAHHIWPWKKFEHLRFDVTNGIALCYTCHRKTYKREYEFIDFFTALIAGKETPPAPEETPVPTFIRCRSCGQFLPAADYGKHAASRWGIFKRCKKCRSKEGVLYQQAHPDMALRCNRRWYNNNLEYRKRYSALWAMSATLRKGVALEWTPKRAALGVVPPNEIDWLIDDIIRQYKREQLTS